MITKESAISIASDHIKKITAKCESVLLMDQIIEFELGWVFLYESSKYLKSGEFGDRLAGNAPIIVNKNDGSITVTGTAHTVQRYIDDYLKAHKG